MSRAVKEWIGKSDDVAIPLRVKLRVFVAADGLCATCTGKIAVGARKPAYDHKVALINGGEHRESNLQLLCVPCHKVKTQADVGEKKRDNRVRASHLGLKKSKGRPMPGSRASGIKMKFGGGWEPR